MGQSNINQRGFSSSKYFGFLNLTHQYFRFLASQAVTLPAYGLRLQWDNFFRSLTPRGNLYPRNLAAYYPNDSTALRLDGSNNVILWEDRSGNSATNALVLNGVAGNYGSSLNSSAVAVTGDIDIRVYVALDTWTPAANATLISKRDSSGTQYSWQFSVIAATGTLQLAYTTDGVNQIAVSVSTALGLSAFAAKWVRVTRSASTGSVNYFSSDDGISWTSIGTQSTATSSMFNSASSVEIGSNRGGAQNLVAGKIYRAQIRNNILDNGTGIVFDANFATFAKLAATGTESSSNAATVTINTTGDTGARISGERDLYQGTAANRPAFTAGNTAQPLLLTFDGTNDYLQTAQFALAQPLTYYFVGKQLTNTSGRRIFDGIANACRLAQNTSPDVIINAGNTAATLSTWAIGEQAIIRVFFNGASSNTLKNKVANPNGPGDAGANSPNGLTLGGSTTGTNTGNITCQMMAIYSEASTTPTMNNVIGYLANLFHIAI